MQPTIAACAQAMIAYTGEKVHLTQHFMKVYSFAAAIGAAEGIEPAEQEILELAALVHDIGIMICLEKYGSAKGPLQEEEGPPLARMLLEALDYPETKIDRVCWLVGHHHTITDVTWIVHRILLEADFLVNAFEGKADVERIAQTRKDVFATATGLAMLDSMYPAS